MAIAFQGDLRPCNMVAEQVASSGRDTRCTRPRFTPAGGYAGRLHDDRPRREEGPCPGDAYGSHSLRRARRLLTYIEDRPHRLPARRCRSAEVTASLRLAILLYKKYEESKGC
jgi:hypothetical protein